MFYKVWLVKRTFYQEHLNQRKFSNYAYNWIFPNPPYHYLSCKQKFSLFIFIVIMIYLNLFLPYNLLFNFISSFKIYSQLLKLLLFPLIKQEFQLMLRFFKSPSHTHHIYITLDFQFSIIINIFPFFKGQHGYLFFIVVGFFFLLLLLLQW